jgi:hypothetical protein
MTGCFELRFQPVVQQAIFGDPNLNGRFSSKRSFKSRQNQEGYSPLTANSGRWSNWYSHKPQISVRVLARSIILSRSRCNAFLLSLSRSAGMDENAVSIAMSFASAIFTFNNCNSCSILSNVRFDKSFSKCVIDCDNRRWALLIQRRSHHSRVVLKRHPTVYVRFGSQADLLLDSNRMAASGTNPALRKASFQNPTPERLLFPIAVIQMMQNRQN